MTPSTALGLFAAASVVALALGVAAAVALHRAGEHILDRLGVPREAPRCAMCGRVEPVRTAWTREDVSA